MSSRRGSWQHIWRPEAGPGVQLIFNISEDVLKEAEKHKSKGCALRTPSVAVKFYLMLLQKMMSHPSLLWTPSGNFLTHGKTQLKSEKLQCCFCFVFLVMAQDLVIKLYQILLEPFLNVSVSNKVGYKIMTDIISMKMYMHFTAYVMALDLSNDNLIMRKHLCF